MDRTGRRSKPQVAEESRAGGLARSRGIQIVLDRLTPERRGLGNRNPGVRVLGEKAAPEVLADHGTMSFGRVR